MIDIGSDMPVLAIQFHGIDVFENELSVKHSVGILHCFAFIIMAYFVRIGSRVVGPFDESQLLDLKSKGKITRSTQLSGNKSDWQAAESFDFLFEPAKETHSAQQSSPNESANWFYSLNGTEGFGPVTATTIEQMLQSGQLNSNSYVWQQGQDARFVKSEPRFNGATPPKPSQDNTGTTTGGGSNGKQVDTGQVLHPLAASLGWLMFLKITVLIGMIVLGLAFLFWKSAANTSILRLITLLGGTEFESVTSAV